MFGRKPLGWIVLVENDEGDLLYAVKEPDPRKAENYLLRELGLPLGKFVFAREELSRATHDDLKMSLTKIPGPF